MAIRNDFSVDFNQSPRLVTIAKPSLECSMQDLLDTLRYLEAQRNAMDNKPLVDASGKEPLGGGTKVGVTVSLQNTLIGFEARDGTEFGGTNEWTLCKLDGGNLVSFDDNDVAFDSPLHNTPFVNVSLTSSSSATLQEQDALQYSSYNGVVSVKEGSSNVGTAYPVGNREYPVNNFVDAKAIADEKGFDTLFVVGNITLDTGDDISEFTVVGQNAIRSLLTIKTGADTLNAEFKNFSINGILDGNSGIENCMVLSLDYVNGYMYNCILNEAEIVLGGGAEAILIDCWSGVAGANTPTIDLGGSGQSLVVRGYNGGLKLINRTGTDPISLDFVSGQFVADATITDGIIYVRGNVGKLTINCDPSLIDISGVTNQETISNAVWNHVI